MRFSALYGRYSKNGIIKLNEHKHLFCRQCNVFVSGQQSIYLNSNRRSGFDKLHRHFPQYCALLCKF